MNNEGLIGWMSGGEVAIIASSIQWRVKSAFITYRCPLCQQMLSRIRSHHVSLIATDSSWCTHLTNSLTAKKKDKKKKEGQDESQCPSQLQHPSAQDQEVMSRLRLASLFAHFVSEQQTSGFSSRWTFSAEMMFNEGEAKAWVGSSVQRMSNHH